MQNTYTEELPATSSSEEENAGLCLASYSTIKKASIWNTKKLVSTASPQDADLKITMKAISEMYQMLDDNKESSRPVEISFKNQDSGDALLVRITPSTETPSRYKK